MESKGAPVLISSSGSPPTGDGSDHQIIRPTPRRATELVVGNSSNDQINRIINARQETDISIGSPLGLPALPTNPPPTSSIPLSTSSFSYPINTETQSYVSQKRENLNGGGTGENGLADLDFSPKRVSRNNSQKHFEEKRNIFVGTKLDDRPHSHTPTKMSLNTEISKSFIDKVSLTRKASSSSPKITSYLNNGNNLSIKNTTKNEMIQGVQQGDELGDMNNREHHKKHNEQIPVRDTGSTTTSESPLVGDSALANSNFKHQSVPSSKGGLVTNVVVDGTSVPVSTCSSVTPSINNLSSVMYVESTGITETTSIKEEPKASNDDSGYQILSSKDEEAERDLQKNTTISPNTNVAMKNKKESSKQGRSSLVKYKAYQGRSKPKRKPQSNQNRSRNSKTSTHFHSNDTNADERLTKSLENANRLLDVKNAIEQLKIRSSHHPSNYMNPGYSSNDNDNTSTSSYSSASDDSDHVSNTTKGSIVAASMSSSSSLCPATTGGMQSGLHATSPMLPTTQAQNLQLSSTKGELSGTHMLLVAGDEQSNSDHFPMKNNYHQQGPTRNVSTKRNEHHNVPDETHNTTVTSADEFVWIDSYNRLVELQKFPWNHTDLYTVISSAQSGRDISPLANTPGGGIVGVEVDKQENKSLYHSADILPRLSYYLQRALVRIAREAQRLSKVTVNANKNT